MTTSWDDIPEQEITKKETRTWSEEQKKIQEWARSSKRNVRVTARAGTGKTTAIEALVVPAAPEKKILYCVFNKKNQVEAQRKITDGRCDIKTFNALGYGFVKQHWAGARPDDQVERDRVKACEPGIPERVVGEVVKLVAWAKNTCPVVSGPRVLEQLCEEIGIETDPWDQDDWGTEELARVAFEVLELSKHPDARGRISFNDQIWLPVVQKWAKPWWDLILVDEAQDINNTQRDLIRACVKPGCRIMLVGDDRQSIYGFRGAGQDMLSRLAKQYDAEELKLTTTYRCAKKIVEVARQEVPEFSAAPGAEEGKVSELFGIGQLVRVAKPGDAILSRVNAPLMPVCLGLLKAGVPARIEGRDVGKMLGAIARKFNARSVTEFISSVSLWMNKKIARIRAKKTLGDEQRIGQINAVQDQADVFFAIAEDAKGVDEILKKLDTLFGDSEEGEKPIVVLSSVHKAKGLEWDRVFVLKETFRMGGEESNIWYVAVTRARKELVWVL